MYEKPTWQVPTHFSLHFIQVVQFTYFFVDLFWNLLYIFCTTFLVRASPFELQTGARSGWLIEINVADN